MNSVVLAKYLSDYKLEIVFDDGKKGIADLAETLRNDHRKIFKELLDKKKFSDFKLGADTVIWSNGLDLAPEFLYGILC